MKLLGDHLRFSATDLADHLACRHLTALEYAAKRGEVRKPHFTDPRRDALRKRGEEHESAFLDKLRDDGLEVLEIERGSEVAEAAATAEAMGRGAAVIAQATLLDGRWMGRADVLRRVERPSRLGEWSYEVMDTKLARTTKAGTVLQLCLYSALLATAQGRRPERAWVVKPLELDRPVYRPEPYRLDEYLAYYRMIRRQLEAALPALWDERTTYPEPVAHCDVCGWWTACDDRRRSDDHLRLVANLGRNHQVELADWGVTTLAGLAALPTPLDRRPRRGQLDTYERLRKQAELQLAARDTGTPSFELLPQAPQGGADRGLARLPEPSPGDLFFDIEGDPFVGSGGREYLLGLVTIGDDGEAVYSARWGFDAADEKASFEALIDEIRARIERHPGLHVYHYAPYEPAALKRLAGRHGSRQDELDELLRANRFVDLYAVVRQSLQAGIERYSIKELERFYGFTREVGLRDVSPNLRALEVALELGQIDALDPAVRQAVEGYNRDDCVSTLHLRDWLESLRAAEIGRGIDLPRPVSSPGAPTEELGARLQAIEDVAAPLREGVPVEREERSADEQARWLLSHLLSWHRREDKAVWWEFFRLGDLDVDERREDPAAIADLRWLHRLPVGQLGATRKCVVDVYDFPPQDLDLGEGDELYRTSEYDSKVGTVAALDLESRRLSIKKTGEARDLHPESLFAHTYVRTDVLADSLLRLGRAAMIHGFDDPPRELRAAVDLLLRPPPLASNPAGTPLRHADEPLLDGARRTAVALAEAGGVLPIQGPPGAGKTYTGARMVVELVARGKKVGITALSHKVITHFVDKVAEAAAEAGVPLRAIQKVSEVDPQRDASITEVPPGKPNQKILDALDTGTQVAAGTAWLWAGEAMVGAVDVLVVDEAGQMSLATALAVAPAAPALILIGDPQQLQQPLKASHPEGTEVSALEHLLGEQQTIPPDRGLFLEHTWRLHPEICAFTSEQFYEGRLRSRDGLDAQRLRTADGRLESGLYTLPCEHRGNKNRSDEEAACIATLVADLLATRTTWVDQAGDEHPLTRDDILVVAPYNAQVTAIAERLPGARIGTVDKFQGQEAPVIIYSMATSSPDEAPRGMEFLYSLHRLNVATSRARCACVLVSSPSLLHPECRTPAQMRLANAMCRYVELAVALTGP